MLSIEELEKIGFEFYEFENKIILNKCPQDYKGELEIPQGVTTIGEEAFSECRNLTNITIPESVTSIGEGAFLGCNSLTNLEIPDSVTSIGSRAFYICKNLTNIKIPDSVTSIGVSAFEGCENLTSIEIPESVTSIGNFAFSQCESLTNIIIPKSVTSINWGAFAGCKSLTSIVIPNGVTSIGEGAFEDCKSLTNITIPDSVTSIEAGAFAGCEKLTNVVISKSITNIGNEVFLGCKNLTNVVIPDSVTSIDKNAFDAGVLLNIKTSDNSRSNVYAGLYDVFKSSNKMQLLENVNNAFVKNTVLKNNALNCNNIRAGAEDYFTLMYNLGLFSKKGTMIEKNNHSKEPIHNAGYTILQNLFLNNNKQTTTLDIADVHTHFQAMKPTDEVNEEFIRFMSDKSNISNIIEQEKKQQGFITRTLDWFEARKHLPELSNEQESNSSIMPTCEANRYKVRVYETAENGVDKTKWKTPTVEYLLKEFAENKFVGVTDKTRHIAEHLSQFNLYEQKHFDKAVELDEERQAKGISDHILEEPLKQDKFESYTEYSKKVEKLKNQALQESSEILSTQADISDKIFSYEMLARSDSANFAMGFYTSCCATLYGAGAGAMRAMITDERMQPLVIKDSNDKIVSFGIVYVNKEKGYAVVNDFEVNRDYQGKDEQRKLIYEKAMQGIDAFATKYNEKNPEQPIKMVTCGISPNWDGVNSFVRENPKSSILDAPRFGDYKYAGSGSWDGDWHREQYVIWQQKGNVKEEKESGSRQEKSDERVA